MCCCFAVLPVLLVLQDVPAGRARLGGPLEGLLQRQWPGPLLLPLQPEVQQLLVKTQTLLLLDALSQEEQRHAAWEGWGGWAGVGRTDVWPIVGGGGTRGGVRRRSDGATPHRTVPAQAATLVQKEINPNNQTTNQQTAAAASMCFCTLGLA